MANKVIEAKRAAAEGRWRAKTEAETPDWLETIMSIYASPFGLLGGGVMALKDMVFGGKQAGTPYIPQTGLYQLHQGERVVPKHQNTGGGGQGRTINVNVRMNAVIKNETSIENLGSRIGSAIAAGFISGVDSEFEIG